MGKPGRTIHKEVTVAAPATAVWEAWTTPAGAATFLGPAAHIELRPGGAYEIWFMPDAPPGARGSDGCIVQEVDPPARLVVTWNFPPSIPDLRDAGARTRVEITFEELSLDETRVTLVQSGWQDGPAWDQGYAYFDAAWALVLDRLRRRFESGPIDWTNPDADTTDE